MDDIKSLVDEFVKWDNLAADCKKEIEKLKAKFQALGVKELEDKKNKQVEFWGSNNAKVVVTKNETLKVASHTFLSQTLGDILKDFAKEKITYDYSEPFKRILIALFQGAYVEQPVDAIIAQITDDYKIRKTLKKKLKGNWEKDVATLELLAGLSTADAEHFAYFIQEAVNYEKIVQLLEAAGHQRGTQQFEVALQALKNAVVVEEGIKVGIEAEIA